MVSYRFLLFCSLSAFSSHVAATGSCAGLGGTIASAVQDYQPAQAFCSSKFPQPAVTQTVAAKKKRDWKRAGTTTTTTSRTTTTTSKPSTTTTTTKPSTTTTTPSTTTTAKPSTTTTTTKPSTTTTTKPSTTTTTTKPSTTTTTTKSPKEVAFSSLVAQASAFASSVCKCIQTASTVTVKPTTTTTTTTPSTTPSTTTSTTLSTTTTTTTTTTTEPTTTTTTTTTTESTTTTIESTTTTTTSPASTARGHSCDSIADCSACGASFCDPRVGSSGGVCDGNDFDCSVNCSSDDDCPSNQACVGGFIATFCGFNSCNVVNSC